MRAGLFLLATSLQFLSSPALGCRCEQQPLSAYFEQADYVAMARLTAADESADRRTLVFELLAAPHKGGDDGQRQGDALRVTTAPSTASCGVQPEFDAVYVVFGASDESGGLRVDSCSGTRVHLSAKLDSPVGFVDVPPRFVAGQLNALLGLRVLADVVNSAPVPDDPRNDTLIGLLDLKALAHGGHMPAYAAPSSSAPITSRVEDWNDLESREVGYEVQAAVVYSRLSGWYRVRLADGSYGWLAAAESGTWFPYEQLPVRRLAYLTDAWSGLVWPQPGAGIPVRSELAEPDEKQEYPVEVHEFREIGGMLWFQIDVLATDPCAGGERKVRFSGWVPAYGRRGDPVAWFYARGC